MLYASTLILSGCLLSIYRMDRMRDNISQSWRTAEPTELTHTHAHTPNTTKTTTTTTQEKKKKKNIIVQHLWLAPRARDVNRDNPTWNKFSVKLWGEPFRLQFGWSNEHNKKNKNEQSIRVVFSRVQVATRRLFGIVLIPVGRRVRGAKLLIGFFVQLRTKICENSWEKKKK